MKPEEFLAKMNELKERYKDDQELFHIYADQLMIECFNSIGYSEGAGVFTSTDKYYA